jgi:hypothetical protein
MNKKSILVYPRMKKKRGWNWLKDVFLRNRGHLRGKLLGGYDKLCGEIF